MSRSPLPPSEVPATPAPDRAPHRIDEFDALRGIAIVFVMYLHAYFGPWATTPHPELLFLRLTHLVANSAVPVFLFMSGFLSARDHSANFATLVEARLRRLAVPLAFWMLVALAFEAWRTGRLTPELIRAFVLFDIAGQFYYVVVLLILTAALYPLRHVDDHHLKWFVVAAFVVNLAMIVYYRTHPLDGFWWSIAYRNPLVWVFSFTFGLYIGRTQGHVRFNRSIIAAAAVGMLLVTAIYVYAGERGEGYPNSYFGVTVFLFAALGFIVYPAGLRALSRSSVGQTLRALSRSSVGQTLLAPFRAVAPYAFGIYLIHKPYFVGELSDRLISNTVLARDYLGLVSSLFIVGGAASIIAVVGINWLFPRFSALMLGVEQPHRSIEAKTGVEAPRSS